MARHDFSRFTGMSSVSEQRITVLIPGIFSVPSEAGKEDSTSPSLPPNLTTLLTRSNQAAAGPSGFELRLFGLFGVAPPLDGDLPVAPVTRLADMGVIDREWWVRADPVYLEPGHDSLVLHAGLNLTQSEADSLAGEINAVLAADGWLLKTPRPERWYLKLPRAALIRTTVLSAAVGHDIHALLPDGAERQGWHTRLSELQILLHTSAVNAGREARGHRPANSVWFWGGGLLPQLGTVGWTQVWSDEPLASGLARLAGLPAAPLPEDAREWLDQTSAGGDSLLVLDQLAVLQLQGDSLGCEPVIQALDRDWIGPLMAAVHAGQLASLTLLSDTGPVFRYQRVHRWRFWRRRFALSGRQEAA